MSQASELLAKLSQAQQEMSALEASWAHMRDDVMPEDVKIKLSELDEEFRPQFEMMQAVIKELENQVKQAVLQGGETVTSLFLQAVYIPGKVTWDSKKMEGYAAAHPDVNALKVEGKPSVTIRKYTKTNKKLE